MLRFPVRCDTAWSESSGITACMTGVRRLSSTAMLEVARRYTELMEFPIPGNHLKSP